MPLLLLMMSGYILKKRGVLNHDFLSDLNNLVYKIAMPILLFNNIYDSTLDFASNSKLILFCVVATLIAIITTIPVVCLLVKQNDKRGVIIQGICRSNFLLFGLEISRALYGKDGTYLISIVMSFVMVIHNIASIIILEAFSDGKLDIKRILSSVYKNNLLRAIVLALIISALNIQVPEFLSTTLNSVSKIATPLALIILGGFFNFKRLRPNSYYLIISVLGKLIIIPTIALLAAVSLGFSGIELAVIVSIIATPTAVSSFSIAKEMNADYELAGQIVAVTCFLCIFTLFIFIVGLTQLGYI